MDRDALTKLVSDALDEADSMIVSAREGVTEAAAEEEFVRTLLLLMYEQKGPVKPNAVKARKRPRLEPTIRNCEDSINVLSGSAECRTCRGSGTVFSNIEPDLRGPCPKCGGGLR